VRISPAFVQRLLISIGLGVLSTLVTWAFIVMLDDAIHRYGLGLIGGSVVAMIILIFTVDVLTTPPAQQ
jgi:hypothetical protein